MSDRPIPDGVTTVDSRGIVRVEDDADAARTVLAGGRVATTEDIAAADQIRSGDSMFAQQPADSRGIVQRMLEDTYGPYWRESFSHYTHGASDEALKYLAYGTGGQDRLNALKEWERQTRDTAPAWAGAAAGEVANLVSFELLGPLAGAEAAAGAGARAAGRGAEAVIAADEAAVAARAAERAAAAQAATSAESGLARAATGAERMAAAAAERPTWYPGMPGTAAFRASAGPAIDAELAAAGASEAVSSATASAESAAQALRALRTTEAANDIQNIERTASTLERTLASGAAAEAEAEAVGGKVADVLSKAAETGHNASAAKALRWLPNGGEIAYGAATGAGGEIRKLIHDEVYNDKPFTYEDVAAAGALGAAFGVGGTVAGTLAAKGIGSALSKMGAGFGEKEAARELLSIGMTKRQHGEILRKFGSLEAFTQELEKGGLYLSKVPAGKLGDAVEMTLAEAAKVRNAALGAAAGAQTKINPERLFRLVHDAIAHETSLTSVGAGHVQNTEMGALLKELGEMTERGFEPGSAFKGKDVIRKLDAIQSRFGQLERGAARSQTESGVIAAGFYGKVKRTIRSEMERAVSEFSPQLWSQYQTANKAYSAAKTMSTFAEKEALNAARSEAAAVGSGIGKSVLGAVASTAIFGKPYNLLYGEGGKFMVKQIATGLTSIERGLAGVGIAINATVAAREGFTRALGALGATASSRVGGALAGASRPISSNMEKYLDPKEFAKLKDSIVNGQPVTAFGSEDSPVSEQEKAVMERFRKGVMSRMAPIDPYVVDRKLWEGQPSKVSSVSTDDLKLLRYIDGAFNPLSIPDKVVSGTAGPEHIEALGELYPSLKAEMDGAISDLMTSTEKMSKELSAALKKPQVRSALSSFIGAPVSAANDPEFAAKLKALREEEAKAAEESKKSGGGGGSGPPAGSGANYMTESERIEK